MKCKCHCRCPNEISFWWMNDNHTFVSLKGKNIDDIIAYDEKCQKIDPYGLLTPAILLKDGIEVKRVGKPVHGTSWSKKNLTEWRKEILADENACELIKGNI